MRKPTARVKLNLFDRSLARNQSSPAISIFHPPSQELRRSDYVRAEVVNNSINSPALWLICGLVFMFARALTHVSFAARRVCSPAEQMGNEKFGRASTFSLLDLSPLPLGTSSRIPWGNLEMARLALPNFLSRRFLCAPLLLLELAKRHRRAVVFFLPSFPFPWWEKLGDAELVRIYIKTDGDAGDVNKYHLYETLSWKYVVYCDFPLSFKTLAQILA
jgi:hypothetical protein